MSRLISKETLFDTETYSVVLKKYNSGFVNQKSHKYYSYILDIDIFESDFLIRHYIVLTLTQSYIKLINKKTKIKSDKSYSCNGSYIFDMIQHYIDMMEIKKEKDDKDFKLESLKTQIEAFIESFNEININQFKTKKLFYEDQIEFFKEPTYQNEILYYSYHPDDEFEDSDISLSHEEYKRKRHSTYVYFSIKDNILSYDLVYKTVKHIIPRVSMPGDEKITKSFALSPEEVKFIKNANDQQAKEYFKNIYWQKINHTLKKPFRDPKKTYLPYYKEWKKNSEEKAIELLKSLFITIAYKKDKKNDYKLILQSDIKNENNQNDMNLILTTEIKQTLKKDFYDKRDNFMKRIKNILFEEFYFIGWRRFIHCYYDKRILEAYKKDPLLIEISIENINPHEYIDAQIKTKKFLEKKYPNQNANEIIQNLQNSFEILLE